MPYAVIRTGGKQYRVEPGDVIRIEALPGEVGSEVAFPEVLLRSGESGLSLGNPLVDGAQVSGKIVAQGRAKKILVYKKKRRKNYRRKKGHRQDLTLLRITEILTDGAKPSKTAAPRRLPRWSERRLSPRAGPERRGGWLSWSLPLEPKLSALVEPPPAEDVSGI